MAGDDRKPTHDRDLDDLLRAAMKTLDEQVPSGYFEALPDRTLARLAAEGTMQSGTGTSTPSPEEDSGLHDIRSLAQTAKERISSKRIPVASDDELLASASGSWKSLALPKPATTISLPDLADLPSATPATATPVVGASIAPAHPARTAPRPSARVKIAVAGVGVAAAAAVTLFVTMQKKTAPVDATPTPARAEAVAAATPPPAAPVVQHIDEPAPSAVAAPSSEVATAEAQGTAGGAAAATGAGAPVPATTTTTTTTTTAAPAAPAPASAPTRAVGKTKTSAHASVPKAGLAKADAPTKDQSAVAKPTASQAAAAPAKKTAGDESFDALLKEAGVADAPKAAKPVLDKKELSASDFKAGMSAIQSKAQGCYQGTQGVAQVKLVIAPSGKVSRVTVIGAFADKPEAACVTAAVKSASFPPWDGGSQTMGYSFLLSE